MKCNYPDFRSIHNADSKVISIAESCRPAPPGRRTVLVPVDGEPFAEHALPLALGIARRAKAAISIVNVYSPFKTFDDLYRRTNGSSLDMYFRRTQQSYLSDLVERLSRVSRVPVRSTLLQGSSIAGTIANAIDFDTKFVVMATHARGPLGRVWHSNTAGALMQQLEVPIILVRGHDAPVDLTGDPLLQHILIPVGTSADAERVLEPAIELGAGADSRFTLLRVIPSFDNASRHAFDMSNPRSHHEQFQAARKCLRDLARRFRERAIPVQIRVISEKGSITNTILDFTRRNHIDLIAMAKYDLGGLSGILRTNVTDRVVRGASVPVFVSRSLVSQRLGGDSPDRPHRRLCGVGI